MSRALLRVGSMPWLGRVRPSWCQVSNYMLNSSEGRESCASVTLLGQPRGSARMYKVTEGLGNSALGCGFFLNEVDRL